MNKRNTKRGFTITELVIVIVVIAILAAVLIPTFASLIKKANMSSDEQAVREMNTVLKSASATAKPADLKDVVDILEEAGYNAQALKPHTKGYEFYWCSEHNVVLLAEVETKTVKFPTDKDLAESFAAHLADGKALVLKEGARYINVEVSSDNIVEALQAGSDITLKEDVVLTQTVNVEGDMTINLNGYKLDSSDNASRPLNVTTGANLTIQAGDKDVECGAYGLVNVSPNAKDCTITLEGGKYTANTDNGAFVRLRPGNENVTLKLKDVNYVDQSDDGFLLSFNGEQKNNNVEIEGGSYKANAGFQIPGNAKFVGVTIICDAVAFEVLGNAEIIDCVITTNKAVVGSAPPAGVAVSNGGTAKVSGCTINTQGTAFYVYTSGGTIIANNNKIVACEKLAVAALDRNSYPNATVARVTVDGKVVAEDVK